VQPFHLPPTGASPWLLLTRADCSHCRHQTGTPISKVIQRSFQLADAVRRPPPTLLLVPNAHKGLWRKTDWSDLHLSPGVRPFPQANIDLLQNLAAQRSVPIENRACSNELPDIASSSRPPRRRAQGHQRTHCELQPTSTTLVEKRRSG